MKSECGQAALGIVLIVALLAIAFLLIGMAANQRGMQAGAEVIGERVGEAIDNVTAPELAASFWVNSQKLTPNKHAIQNHGDTAWKSTDCYNRNGAFQIWRIGNREFHLLCKDDDGSVRNIMLERESNTSNWFHMKNAFTRDNSTWDAVKAWLESKGGNPVRVPKDMVIIIDGIIP